MTMTDTQKNTRDERIKQHLDILECVGPLPELSEVKAIADAIYDLFEKMDGRANSLEWLSEFGGDEEKYRQLGAECVQRGHDLRLALELAFCGSLPNVVSEQARPFAMVLVRFLLPGLDNLDLQLRHSELDLY
jgi:hypothetical protein